MKPLVDSASTAQSSPETTPLHPSRFHGEAPTSRFFAILSDILYLSTPGTKEGLKSRSVKKIWGGGGIANQPNLTIVFFTAFIKRFRIACT